MNYYIGQSKSIFTYYRLIDQRNELQNFDQTYQCYDAFFSDKSLNRYQQMFQGNLAKFCVETFSGLELRRIRVSIHYNCLLNKLNQSHCFKQGFQLNAIVPISASDKSKHGLQII